LEVDPEFCGEETLSRKPRNTTGMLGKETGVNLGKAVKLAAAN